MTSPRWRFLFYNNNFYCLVNKLLLHKTLLEMVQSIIDLEYAFVDADKTTFRRDVGNHSLSMLGAERYQNQLCSTANAEMFK